MPEKKQSADSVLEHMAKTSGRLFGRGRGLLEGKTRPNHSGPNQKANQDDSIEEFLPEYPVTPVDLLTENLAIYFAGLFRISRRLAKTERIGAALSGATKRAWFQIGVLKFMDDYDIPLSVLTGVSSGAMVNAGYEVFRQEYEAHPENFNGFRGPAHKLEHFVLQHGNLTPEYGPIDFPLHEGVIHPANLDRFLEQLVCEKNFWDAPRLRVVVHNLSTGENVVYGITDKDTKIKDAVRQSVAYPGLIETVKREDGSVASDGGILRKIPLRELYHFDPDLTLRIAVYVGGPPEPEDIQLLKQAYTGNGRTHARELLELIPAYPKRLKQSISGDAELLHLGISNREWGDYQQDVLYLTGGKEVYTVEQGGHTGLIAIRTERGFVPKLSVIDTTALSNEGYRAAYKAFQNYFGMIPQQLAYFRRQYGLELREIRYLNQIMHMLADTEVRVSNLAHSPWIPH